MTIQVPDRPRHSLSTGANGKLVAVHCSAVIREQWRGRERSLFQARLTRAAACDGRARPAPSPPAVVCARRSPAPAREMPCSLQSPSESSSSPSSPSSSAWIRKRLVAMSLTLNSSATTSARSISGSLASERCRTERRRRKVADSGLADAAQDDERAPFDWDDAAGRVDRGARLELRLGGRELVRPAAAE